MNKLKERCKKMQPDRKEILRVTHQGIWKVSEDVQIECYVTSNKKRFLSLRGTARAMRLVGGGSRALMRVLRSKWIQPYLSDHLKSWVNRALEGKIERLNVISGSPIIPFETNLFVDVCKAYMLANKDGKLPQRSQKTAQNLLSIMTAFAKVGIDALVDEITGYQEEREKDELQKILKMYISEEFLEWTKMFPDEFYNEMFRLNNLGTFGEHGRKMPKYIGRYTNDIIYGRLPLGVLDVLKKKTPKSKSGNRTVRYHQSLTREQGRKHLEKHLAAVIALMKVSETWSHFLYMLDKAYPKKGQQRIHFY